MKFIPKLWAERADQKHVNNRSRLVSAPGANYYNGRQTSPVWQQNMSCSRKSRTWQKPETALETSLVPRVVTETTGKNNLRSTRENFKYIKIIIMGQRDWLS